MAEFWGFKPVEAKRLIFASYNSLDWERVAPIALELRKMGVPVWYDHGLQVGTDAWGTQISKHIDMCSALVLFVTKGIFERDESYVIEEYNDAKNLRRVIVPVFLDDVMSSSYYRTIDVKYRRYLNFWLDLQGVAYQYGMSDTEIAAAIKSKLDQSRQVKYPTVPWNSAEAVDPGQSGYAQSSVARISRYVSIGDRVQFGRYPQSSNNSEPITWRVLDVKGGKALMISEYLLDSRRFDAKSNRWSRSELHDWLNKDFLGKAFDLQEQRRLCKIDGDKVTCLAADEANIYFSNAQQDRKGQITYPDRMAKTTAYARKNGAAVDSDLGTGWWWLRSPGNGDQAASVYSMGGVYSTVTHISDMSVRPVIMISL